MDINDLYRSLLEAAGLNVTSDGYVRALDLNKEWMPATKNKRQLVIPLLEQLRSPMIKDRMVFHPLSENVLQKESEVLSFYRHLLVCRLNSVINTLGLDLLTLAASPAVHSSLTPDQSGFLTLVQNADEKTVQDFTKLIAAMPANQVQRTQVAIFLKKAGTIGKKGYQQVASVNFPLYMELQKWEKEEADKKADKDAGHKAKKPVKAEGGKTQHTVYDVPLRQMDRSTLIGLMEYLIPQINEPEAYNRGSNSTVAPGLDALMHSFMSIAGHLNGIIELFTGAIADIERLTFNSDWVETFDNLEVMWSQIRNIPSSSTVETLATTPAAAPQPSAQPPSTGFQHVKAPVIREPLPWNALANPPPPVAPVYPAATWAAGNQQGGGQWVNGQWIPAPPPQQQQQQAPSGHGTSFSAILQGNPQLMNVLGPQNQQQQQQMYAQQQNTWPPQNQQRQAPVMPWHVGSQGGGRRGF